MVGVVGGDGHVEEEVTPSHFGSHRLCSVTHSSRVNAVLPVKKAKEISFQCPAVEL